MHNQFMQFQLASFQLHLTIHKSCQAFIYMQMKFKELELELEACCNMVGWILSQP
jgi:hypothetical protein